MFDKNKFVEMVKSLEKLFVVCGAEQDFYSSFFAQFIDLPQNRQRYYEQKIYRYSDSMLLVRGAPRLCILVGIDQFGFKEGLQGELFSLGKTFLNVEEAVDDQNQVQKLQRKSDSYFLSQPSKPGKLWKIHHKAKVSQTDVTGVYASYLSLLSLVLQIAENFEIAIAFCQGSHLNHRGIKILAPLIDSLPSVEYAAVLSATELAGEDKASFYGGPNTILQARLENVLNQISSLTPFFSSQYEPLGMALESAGLGKEWCELCLKEKRLLDGSISVSIPQIQSLYDGISELSQWGSV